MTIKVNSNYLRFLLAGIFIAGISIHSTGQTTNQEPWTESQLMAPAELAKLINEGNANQPLVFCIGPSAIIKGSVNLGAAKDKDNLKNLKQQLLQLPKTKSIVIYCGCCPFQNCPNIRPAFELLNKMNFINHKLLNLPKNIKVDWIDKGYPKNE